MASDKLQSSVVDKTSQNDEQQVKVNKVREMIGSTANELPTLFSDASILRYLRARKWNTKKTCQMLRETAKWRMEYKPEQICWDEIAHEAETGKTYRSNYPDKYGRTVLVMRPGLQNTYSTSGQMKFLVYCMENAIMNLPPGEEQMDHYPERLGQAILYNPPKIFESFWMLVKPYFEARTSSKIKFVYSNDPESQKFMEGLFDMEKLESALGGQNPKVFDCKEYGETMREDDKKIHSISSVQ
ncbi:hypothetical protein C5167_003591 [Papaver somniferum]|uniref:CRAL-TRIO domain-containing protein n=1 Tax=Papaver somniferum TaxID=3469 RepID=A0A4Y7L0K9_PAPSO|nr:hypothetical protein C5167_003591 [Papaver somniferum]